jgi:ribonuclease Y
MDMDTEWTSQLFLAFVLGLFMGMALLWLMHRIKLGRFKTLAAAIIAKAEQEAATFTQAHDLSIKQKQLDSQRDIELQLQGERRKIQKEEQRLSQREETLQGRTFLIEKKLADIEKREEHLQTEHQRVKEETTRQMELQKQLMRELEANAGLSSAAAKELLLQRAQHEIRHDIAALSQKLHREAEEQADRKATSIIATAINRLAVSCTSETTVCTVAIPHEEMKGRIIGREGRNIRALEQATGVNVIIDDAPNVIVLSGFDPMRKQVAKLAILDLMTDGRIHPTRIDEAVAKAKETMTQQVYQHGEDAAMRIGAIDLHPELIALLGKLKFRFSFGQNILEHSLEVAHLLGLMAAELDIDIAMAKRIGLLHDIGKAVSHEMSGSHAMIGMQLALKYGESKEVANGIGCHHHEIEPITVEGSLCSAADALSGSRLGARLGAVEEYIARMKKLEEIAQTFPGIDKVYVLQAGREVRVIVLPDMIDDTGITLLSRDLTKKIEEQSYPGKIKVTVIREKQAVSYAR